MKRICSALLMVGWLAACGGSKEPPPSSGGTGGDSAGQGTGTGEGQGPATGESGGGAACAPTGCSGTVCAAVGEEIVTTCEYRPEYECYKRAVCALQPDGKCGWNQTADLSACLAKGGEPAPQ